MNAVDERVELIENILANRLTKRQVENAVKELENKYGEEAFTRFTFQKEEKPWDQEYYNKLKSLSMSGAGSKEFILHLTEVRDEANKFDAKKMVLAGIAVVAAIVAVILLL